MSNSFSVHRKTLYLPRIQSNFHINSEQSRCQANEHSDSLPPMARQPNKQTPNKNALKTAIYKTNLTWPCVHFLNIFLLFLLLLFYFFFFSFCIYFLIFVLPIPTLESQEPTTEAQLTIKDIYMDIKTTKWMNGVFLGEEDMINMYVQHIIRINNLIFLLFHIIFRCVCVYIAGYTVVHE